ncbi:MAG: PilZ domain-containing protein [Acidobacteria bacterium]|nr:PilZ domain-containing protein [Acidobacteriota bacterium]
MPIALRVDSDPERVEHTASTIDLSGYGARLHTSAGLVPGQSIAVIIDEGSGGSISGRDVWVGPIGSHLEGHAGIEFLSPLPGPS